MAERARPTALGVLFPPLFALSFCPLQDSPSADLAEYESEIAAFEAEDRVRPSAEGSVLFLGSSTIRLWDLERSFPDLPVINRGFGGSRMDQAAHYAGRILAAHEPRVVVIYEGDNDVNAGHSPERVAEDFARLLGVIRDHAPEARLVVLGIKPSPARWPLYPTMSEANRLVAELARADGNAALVDLGPLLLDDEGRPIPRLYQTDGLHLSPAGYRAWTARLRRSLEE